MAVRSVKPNPHAKSILLMQMLLEQYFSLDFLGALSNLEHQLHKYTTLNSLNSFHDLSLPKRKNLSLHTQYLTL